MFISLMPFLVFGGLLCITLAAVDTVVLLPQLQHPGGGCLNKREKKGGKNPKKAQFKIASAKQSKRNLSSDSNRRKMIWHQVKQEKRKHKAKLVHSDSNEFIIATRVEPHLGHPGPLQLWLAVGLFIKQGERFSAGG